MLHIEVAKYLKKTGGSLYFFSTTNVFDDDLCKPHYENEVPKSCTDYGQYKVNCENEIGKILADKACIIRIPQVWGRDSSRIKELINASQNNKEIVVYPKLFFNTNTDVMIARQLNYIINNNLRGIFHLASEDIVNYKNFYLKLIRRLGLAKIRTVESLNEEGHFALLSKRIDEFPEDLRINNESVISYLCTRTV